MQHETEKQKHQVVREINIHSLSQTVLMWSIKPGLIAIALPLEIMGSAPKRHYYLAEAQNTLIPNQRELSERIADLDH